jgi:hypothetical protein
MLLLLGLPKVFAGALISEVVYQAAGSDSGQEWVELCNDGNTAIDLTNYTIEMAGSSWKTVYTLGAGTLNPGEYIVVAGPYATIYTGSFSDDLENAGSSIDGVRLKDASGNLLDTVLYGQDGSASNASNLEDDTLSTDATRAAPDHNDTSSIGRTACLDTNNSANDFTVFSSPTPGAANESGGGGDSGGSDSGGGGGSADCTDSDFIKINELLPDATGSDSGQEWVELFNNGSRAVKLDYWVLEWDGSDFSSASTFEIPENNTLQPGGYLLLGAGGLTEANLTLGNASSNADGVRITCNGTPVDVVVYGDTNSDNLPDETGNPATSLAPAPSEGASIVRKVDGEDNNTPADDFILCETPSPGSVNTCVIVPCTVTSGVVINEFNQNTDEEWIELFNSTSRPVDLAGWRIEWGTSSYNKSIVLPVAQLASDGYYVIGTPQDGVDWLDYSMDMDMGNATSNADSIRLVCEDDTVHVLDTVIYAEEGKSNDDGWLDDNNSNTNSLAPVAEKGMSSARIPNGVDTQNSGDDFKAVTTPTPGEPNSGGDDTGSGPCSCQPGGAIKINEVLYDSAIDDETGEWVELYNAGSEAVELCGYTLEAAKSSWDDQYTQPSSFILEPGGFFLIGAEDITADVLAEDLDLGNGTEGDGVRVLDCEGTVIDTVLYGEELADEILGDGDSTWVVPTVESGYSIGRYPDGIDTDTLEDWKIYVVPSPDASNPNPSLTQTPCAESSGCKRDPACPDTTGCAVPLPGGGMEALLGLLVLVRRKR